MKRSRLGWDDGDDLDSIQYEEDRSPSAPAAPAAPEKEKGEDEVDPLDAFMEGIHEEVSRIPTPGSKPSRIQEEEEEEDDPMETFLKARRDAGLSLAAEALHAGYDSDEEVYAAARAVEKGMVDYDSDDNAIITADRKKIDPLAPLDHSQLQYAPFDKDFYEEDASISGLSEEDVTSYRQSIGVRTSGFDVPRPVKQFKELGLDSLLMGAITKQGYENPTPIQCQALPIVLSGRDIIGIAKTGSGKTAAFVLPMIVHIMDQEELGKGEGPIGVICAPTRELAQQIFNESRKFAKPYGIRVSGVFGGMSKLDQFKELKAGCEIVVATPGRLIDMLKMKALTMFRATYLVLDEADRMFDLGFEPQIRSIVGQIRPDRQTLLFSATMPRRVETLAREVLSAPVRVTAGEVGRANEDVTQVAQIVATDADKLQWMLSKLPQMVDAGDVLVFASTKVRVEELEKHLQDSGFKVAALHGDKDQASRVDVLQGFKSGQFHVLVATDVAARGLDIKSIKTVVNYDTAKDMDTHVHRVGRTGRAGDKEGVAYTLVTQKEARFAGDLVNGFVAAGQNVPSELMDLAMKDGRFRAQREGRRKGGKGRGGRGGGRGKGGGGGGRGVRGVDYGLGIGYSRDASSNPSAPVHQARKSSGVGAASSSPSSSMMTRFKNSFVAASSSAGGAATNTVLPGSVAAASAPLRGFVAASTTSTPPLRGFVAASTNSNSPPSSNKDSQQKRQHQRRRFDT
ncbi:DEAD-box ATP-dependent RNA helicase 24 [Selaginella moellendorffii]|uniref:DEAD-box ATP-dependent RNA helicase 24 n=1 Tax=Selaginella moellendorffii TaxID=88036 RepID=UPI000D1CF8C8|nr:DEAD-box ATP-dependent RNA helicase 24 [Selaginella moellendorffii]|eukprot:XP_024541622.1 DEAD-box ATP-dependent RNA helicase 24 [Selaginella moellendorffii]